MEPQADERSFSPAPAKSAPCQDAPGTATRQTARRSWRETLRDPTLLILIGMFLIGVGGMVWEIDRLKSSIVESTAVNDAAIHTKSLEVFRTLYTSEVVERVRPHGTPVRWDYDKEEGAIPLPATLSMEIGNRLGAEQQGGRARLFSDYPFPWRKDSATLDRFETEALQRLRERPDKPFYRFETVGGERVLRYATADLMRESCVDCHNTTPQSPKIDWKVGDVRGVLEVIHPLENVQVLADQRTRGSILLLATMTAGGIVALILVIARFRRIWGDLEDRVAARTADLAQSNTRLETEINERKEIAVALEQHASELERSNAELEQFAYAASHDLQEPLRTIRSYIQLLESRYADLLDADAKEFIGFASDGAARLQCMVHDLLAFSKVGTEELSLEIVDLGQIVDEVKQSLEAQIEESGAIIEAGELPPIRCSRNLFRQLFQNLIGNAIKFRGKEAPRIQVNATRSEDNRHLISIRDNGIGIDPKFADRVFQVFKRLHGPTQYPGSGIGLAICKKIVERHGGSIWVTSNQNQGSTFFIALPRNDADPTVSNDS